MTLLLMLTLAQVAGPPDELEQARREHQALDFEACLGTLDRAARHHRPARELAEIALWQGLCAAGLNDTAGALAHFRLALELEPQLQLPPHSAPKVTELFAAARPKAPPSEAPVVVSVPAPSAPAPRPWWAIGSLAGVAAVSGGVSLGFGLDARAAMVRANSAVFADDAAAVGAHARSSALVSNALLAFALVSLGAALLVLLLARGSPP
ncbi:MAG: hypothetical protein IPJ65_19035 [Archangiaceae bacterium]|nr:hypothetical protein [Archangiaceae bacterium]